MKLKEYITNRAVDLGFHALGVAASTQLREDGALLEGWLQRKHQGEMRFLERWTDVRIDPSHSGMVPGARSIISLAIAYADTHHRAPSGLLSHVARYARGPDYHHVVRQKLSLLLQLIKEEFPFVEGRALVDTAPIFERAWAVRAGLGWIGRNTCLINPRLGSMVVLGELVLTAEIEPDTGDERDRCGSCRACIEACPTSALAAPDGHDLDARRCLSFWTVEAKSPMPAPIEEKADLFGCDICQLVCPYNNVESPLAQTPLAPLERWSSMTLEGLAAMSEEDVKELISGTALERAGALTLRSRAQHLLKR